MSNDKFPFGDDDDIPTNDDIGREAKELRDHMRKVHKKITGENTEPATNEDVLQFLRVVNYNFLSLTRLLQSILLKTAEMDTTLVNLTVDTTKISTQMTHFFEMSSLIDEVTEDEDLDVSGSATNSGLIF